MQKEGIDFFETHVPVVQSSTGRALLVLSIILGLESCQIDFSNAFCQADIQEEVYVEMPRILLIKMVVTWSSNAKSHYMGQNKPHELGFLS